MAGSGRIRALLHRAGLLPRLLVAELVLLGLLCVGGYVLIVQLTGSLESGIRREWYLLGSTSALAIDGALERGIAALQAEPALAAAAAGATHLSQAQPALDEIATASGLFTDGVLLVNADRQAVAADAAHGALVHANLGPSWPQDVSPARGGQVLVWGITGPAPLGGTIAVAVPLADTPGGPYAVGLIDGQHSAVNEIIDRALELGRSGHGEVVDSTCHMLWTTESGPFLDVDEHPAMCFQGFRSGQPMVEEATTRTAEREPLLGPHLMAFAPLKTLPLALEVGTTTGEAYAPATTLRTVSLVFLAVLASVALAGTLLAGSLIVAPVRALSAAARRVAEGAASESIGTPWGGEIGELAASLEIMRVRLRRWGQDLEEQVRKRTEELEQRNRELARASEGLRQQDEQRRALMQKVLTAQEDERHRVSRELHDGIGQALWALTINLEQLAKAGPRGAALERELGTLQRLASSSLDDLRRLTVALRPSALDDLGLVPAIRRYAELYLSEAGVDLDLQAPGTLGRLDPTLETVVYRVVQEAINNVARHSHARHVSVRLSVRRGGLVAEVADDGDGFDRQHLSAKTGLGIQGMQERASLVGGTFEVQSAPGAGTRVRLDVPLRSA